MNDVRGAMSELVEGLNRKAAALDSQTGESFSIGVKAALESLWSTYLLFSAYKKHISADLPPLHKIPLTYFLISTGIFS